jgi:hypothetical protein
MEAEDRMKINPKAESSKAERRPKTEVRRSKGKIVRDMMKNRIDKIMTGQNRDECGSISLLQTDEETPASLINTQLQLTSVGC